MNIWCFLYITAPIRWGSALELWVAHAVLLAGSHQTLPFSQNTLEWIDKNLAPHQPPGKSVQAYQESHLKKTVCFRLGERTAGARITHSAVGKLWACWWHTLSSQTNRRKPCARVHEWEKNTAEVTDRMVIQTGRGIPCRWSAFPEGARSNTLQRWSRECITHTSIKQTPTSWAGWCGNIILLPHSD